MIFLLGHASNNERFVLRWLYVLFRSTCGFKMKNQERWEPTKFVRYGKIYRASRNPKEVGVSSRLIADLTVKPYAEYLPKYAKGRLIDLGCGNVPLYLIYKNFIEDVVCVDWTNTAHKNEFLDVECDLGQSLPFKNNEFDTILLSDVLEHLKHPENLWREMHRILQVNGYVLLNVPFYYWLHEAPYDYYRYTKFALISFAEKNGFKVIILKELGGAPEIICDIVSKYLHFFVPKLGKYLAALVQRLGELWLKVGMLHKISGKSAQIFPLGYFMVVQKM